MIKKGYRNMFFMIDNNYKNEKKPFIANVSLMILLLEFHDFKIFKTPCQETNPFLFIYFWSIFI